MITVGPKHYRRMTANSPSCRYLLAALVLLLPLNIYVIGDWIGAGVQFSLFRYQQTYLGSSVISLLSDLGYVFSGTIGGRSAFSILCWMLAAGILVAGVVLVLGHQRSANPGYLKRSGILFLVGACLAVFSLMIQYGPTFSGMSGFAIPVGIPPVAALGWWLYTAGGRENRQDEGDEGSPL
jgi:hypothetical protein